MASFVSASNKVGIAVLSPIAIGIAVFLCGPVGLAQQPKKQTEERVDVWSIAISKDGKIVASSAGRWDQTGEIGVWNLETHKPLQRFAEDRGVCSVALSSDGKLLASGSWTGHARVYDWAANKQIADFDTRGVARVAFSPNDELLATATERKTLQLWDLTKRKLLCDLEGELMRFLCVMFSPDGKKLLAGGGDWKQGGVNQVVIWDVETKEQIMKLVGHDNAVVCVTYSPDGNTIVTGSVDKTIRFWHAKTGMHLKTLKGHSHWVEALVFTNDGKTLISSSHDHTVRFWDVEKGVEKEEPLTMPGSVRALHLTPDGKSLLVGGGPKILMVLNAADRTALATLWNDGAQKVVVANEPLAPPQVVAMANLPIANPARPANRGWLLAGLLLGGGLVTLFIGALAVRYYLARRSA